MGPGGRETKIEYSRYPRFGKGGLTSEVRWTLGSEIRISVIPKEVSVIDDLSVTRVSEKGL